MTRDALQIPSNCVREWILFIPEQRRQKQHVGEMEHLGTVILAWPPPDCSNDYLQSRPGTRRLERGERVVTFLHPAPRHSLGKNSF